MYRIAGALGSLTGIQVIVDAKVFPYQVPAKSFGNKWRLPENYEMRTIHYAICQDILFCSSRYYDNLRKELDNDLQIKSRFPLQDM